MTQVWQGDQLVAVTKVQAGPCVVTQVKDEKTDGYQAIQVAFATKKAKNIRKPQLGHFKALNIFPRFVKEFRGDFAVKAGDKIDVNTFQAGDIVAVTGVSKGKGFQGVVRRHHFHGFRKTHGNKDQERASGSIGPKGPAHVFKGTRMGGRMGDDQVTTKNLEIIAVNSEDNTLLIKGAVPGANNGFLLIKGDGELSLVKSETPVEAKIEEKVVEISQEVKPEEIENKEENK